MTIKVLWNIFWINFTKPSTTFSVLQTPNKFQNHTKIPITFGDSKTPNKYPHFADNIHKLEQRNKRKRHLKDHFGKNKNNK